MSSGSAAVCVFDSDDGDGAKNRNISELISTLRTAYRTKDFDRVEEILVSREAKLKREMQDMKKENGFLYEQGEELKRLVVLEKAAQDAAQVGERKAVERYEKLLEEVKRGGGRDDDKRVILELKKKCCVLECAKMKAESEVELWKRRFKELGIRVSKLEEDTAMLMDLQSAACPTSASGAIVDIIDSDDDHAPGGILCREGNKDLIDKVSSGMLKRKQTTSINVSENPNGGDHKGDDDICPTSKRKRKRQEELIRDTDGSRADHCSATALSSGCKNVDELTSSSRQCEEKMKTVHASRNLMHELVLAGDSDSSFSSSDSDDEFISSRSTKLQRKLRV
ncbi:hypothetical protein I3842_11G123100 [Carya illinoinensis]|uniref:Uncharacterized protein n=1 Tax=Carya illinoinensis TaxID=32201 RepID=A0A922IZ70_CARIL|nr:hypothetical protein I3842_11G123100 [Carya illinoinensis]